LELPALDRTPLLLAIVITLALATTASLVPAWNASRLSPMVAMREAFAPSPWRWFGDEQRRRLKKSYEAAEGDRAAPGPPPSLFADAARTAASSHDALQRALAALVVKLDLDWAMLLETGEHGFRYQKAGRDGASTQGELPSSGFLINRLHSHDGALSITSDDLDAWREWAAVERPQHVDEIAALRGAGVRLAMALRSQRQIRAVLLLGAPSGERAFSNAERQALGQAGHQLALMIENVKLTARILEQEALRRDLALAAEVQRRLLPDRPPRRPAASLAAFTIAARNVAGDYYDFLEIGDGRLGIALADVSGKGVAAALIMSVVQASLRIIASDEHVPLDRLAARMNQFLYRSTQSSSYATFFYAQLDERSKRIEYVNAGHNPPYLIPTAPADGAPRLVELSTGGMVLGLFPDVTFERESVQLHAGDLLFIFSDGVPEALDARGEELGADRLQRLLFENHHLGADEIAERVAAFVREWSAGAPQHDDITFIVMKVVDGV
jgi:sigma-B regulation protein RsbU (phosphoserine phosphatase)